MSKNFNRKKLEKVYNNKEYNVVLKNQTVYCQICAKRAGNYKASCHPAMFKEKHPRWREFRTWKYNRKKQYK